MFTGAKTFQTAPVFGADVSIGLVNDVDILDLWQNAVKNVGDQDITHGKTFTSEYFHFIFHLFIFHATNITMKYNNCT